MQPTLARRRSPLDPGPMSATGSWATGSVRTATASVMPAGSALPLSSVWLHRESSRAKPCRGHGRAAKGTLFGSHVDLRSFADRWLAEREHDLGVDHRRLYRWHLESSSSRVGTSRSRSRRSRTTTSLSSFATSRDALDQTGAAQRLDDPGAVNVFQTSSRRQSIRATRLEPGSEGLRDESGRRSSDEGARKRILTIDEIDSLLDAAGQGGSAWVAFVSLGVFAGIRFGERSVFAGRLDLDDGLFRVQDSETGRPGVFLRDVKTLAGRREVPLADPRRILVDWKLKSGCSRRRGSGITTAIRNSVSHRNALRTLCEIAPRVGSTSLRSQRP